MKKCPTCENTFEDNLRFCQTDGTPLVTVEEEAPAEDPYKTIVVNQSNLSIPPEDPFKTVVAGSSSLQEIEEPPEVVPEAVLDIQELPEAEAIDPMKTIMSSDFPAWQQEQLKSESKQESPAVDTPLPSPFSEPSPVSPEEPQTTGSDDFSATPPEPPKFSEPDLNPPTFGDMSSKPASPSAETPSFQSPQIEPPPVETSFGSPVSSDPPPPPPPPFADEPSGSGQLPVAPPVNISKEPSPPEESYGSSPFGKPENTPIPSPFDDSASSNYQPPSTPMPKYKEPEQPFQPPPPSPFGQPSAADQSLQESGWSPPPAPDAGWPNQGIGQNTPFQPPPAGASGPSQILAFVSLGLGILGIILLIPALLIPLCGTGSFLLGIGAAITGFLARSRAKQQPEQYAGAGLGLVGLILGVLSIIAPIAIFIFYLVLFAGLNILGNR